ncbi:MAG TPA: hypothetical protein VF228_24105 [Iamia sp.]
MRARLATEDDVAALARLGAARRRRLAEWAPVWWRMADGADELHPLWLAHLVTSAGPVARVVDDSGEIVAGAIALPQGPTWFVDDVAATTEEAAACLLDAVTERPALTCVPAADADGSRRAGAAGWAHVSSYWIGPPAAGEADAPAGAWTGPVPPHTFGPALAGGWAGGLPAPPVYDPGGTVTIVATVAGPDRAAALGAELADAARRGDVLLALVVGADDEDLAMAAAAAGLERTVDVRAAPA